METSNYLVHGLRIMKINIIDLITYALIIFIVVLYCVNQWKIRHVKLLITKMKGPPSYPIIGSLLNFVGSPREATKKLIKLSVYGPEPFKVRLGTELFVVLTKPEDLQIVLNNSNALTKHPFYGLFNNLFGKGLFTAPVHIWKKNRRIIHPLISSNVMIKKFFPIFIEKDEILINNLQKEVGKTQMFNLWDYIASNTLDSICQTTMGYNLEAQTNPQCQFANALIKITEENTKRLYHPWLYPEIIFSIYEKFTNLNDLYKIVNKIPNFVIKEMKKSYMNIENNIIYDSDMDNKNSKLLLGKLLELNDSGTNFTDIELRDEVITMLVAGSETTAVTDCFCLLMLAMYPDIQDKVYGEIYSILGDSDQTITFEDISKLVYLEQVLNETIRLFPAGPVLFRVLTDDVKIYSNNYILPKGTSCGLHLIGTHYNPKFYPNPMTFNPENFSPENIAQRHKYSFLPFSSGPRGCIGSKYAMLSMKLLICTVLQNFSVHTELKFSDIKLKVDLVLRSDDGYPITIRPRNKIPPS